MIIDLRDYAGEFCSSRTDPSIPALRQCVRNALLQGDIVQVSRKRIKSITVSFLDEWLGPIIVELGLERVRKEVRFDPPLEPILAKQLERSSRLRTQQPG
ncbi:MAG: hypothetical protein AABZ06_05730 [Bdellovibrionota bacterium]